MASRKLYYIPQVAVIPLMGESPFMALAPSKEEEPKTAPKRREPAF